MRRRLFLFAVAAAGLLATSAPRARAGGQRDEHVRFRRTYAQALLECRARNLPLLLSRHKDD